ncbi:hypothetical protein CC1G_09555 [Coprinopsis cinerea okayama7|uniref:Uncharacterized protein n=1 Tax=Coprinopsis cinerea (strain Okayama-7 / 130 / ATCC MYA-4618 / FGSC 9003) TaxID=240176 RepID=A8P954_COPC7|nr:hypothetical protein CC1G_09555 [Coprinopsis cinerea okayama7\|eukprot:XP_001839700.1 hypothetical protein CC1G_09555 [Coprinopsis cinerea okayama7\
MPACYRFTRPQLVFIGVCSAYLCQARLRGEEDAFLESFFRIYFSRYPLQRQHHPTIESEEYAREFITGRVRRRLHRGTVAFVGLRPLSDWKQLEGFSYRQWGKELNHLYAQLGLPPSPGSGPRPRKVRVNKH